MADVQAEALVSSSLEKGHSVALAFQNDDVTSLSWKDLSVKVSDKVIGHDKFILQGSSGIVHAGRDGTTLFVAQILSLTGL